MTDMSIVRQLAPHDPLERVKYLLDLRQQLNAQLWTAIEDAYFEARLQQRLDEALVLGLHSRKVIMASTRHANERRGRQVRWNDGRG
jgi:hypothetical protein